ncbi:MAG: hypothetical protein KBT46_01735, partial [Ruminococcus sp.]|nr:hypothetical protein [Candidatus Copronaster equi]
DLPDVDLSFFTNAITNHTKGSIKNISENNLTVGNLFFSIFSKMANNAEYAAEKLDALSAKKIVFCGGIVRKNTVLCEMIKSKFANADSFFVAENETLKGIISYVEMNS